MFEDDYIMRQIKECCAAVLRLVFHINVESPATLLIKDKQKQDVATRLTDLIDDGKIREAMAELDSETADKTLDDLLIGYRFYTHLCQKDDDFLEKYMLKYSDIEYEMKQFFSKYASSEVVDLLM